MDIKCEEKLEAIRELLEKSPMYDENYIFLEYREIMAILDS